MAIPDDPGDDRGRRPLELDRLGQCVEDPVGHITDRLRRSGAAPTG